MLMLLKPWQNIKTDLKSDSETWKTAFNQFMETALARVHCILARIQYYHDSKSAARKERARAMTELPDTTENSNGYDKQGDMEEDPEEKNECVTDFLMSYTEKGLQELKASVVNWAEKNHGIIAIMIARQNGIFNKKSKPNWKTLSQNEHVQNATARSMTTLQKWKLQMGKDVVEQNRPQEPGNKDSVTVTILTDEAKASVRYLSETYNQTTLEREEVLAATNPSMLKPDQR
ncbi:hypothetical protein BDQ17DRAFT_1330730 [Cyathus striatus]|nr:hypothetical protein BDQ17DRAFT_1330730 [Cyathus striatus]